MEIRLEAPESFYREEVKVVGVTHNNADGKNRQDILYLLNQRFGVQIKSSFDRVVS